MEVFNSNVWKGGKWKRWYEVEDVRLECYGRRQGRRLSLGVVRDFKSWKVDGVVRMER